jgi:glycosyltransferase involved in cell wall biosynthesis
MEAMAMETPAVSTTISGIPELVDHEENGLFD